jgi:hypothetical protein
MVFSNLIIAYVANNDSNDLLVISSGCGCDPCPKLSPWA